MIVAFHKMHGAGNDFVVVDHRRPFLPADLAPLVVAWCDRRRGIGADGVLLLESDAVADFAMRYFNADGRPAEYCGNGARCLARLALDLGLGNGARVRFRTESGLQDAWRAPDGRGIVLGMGGTLSEGEPCAVEAAGRAFEGRLIRAGVPHFVTGVEHVEHVPVGDWGRRLRHHPRFAPEGVNVDFVAPLPDGRLALRTFERGVESETLACGSGAVASALWAASRGAGPRVRLVTAGGDELEVALDRRGADYGVTITGPAEMSFTGQWGEPPSTARTRGEEPCSKD